MKHEIEVLFFCIFTQSGETVLHVAAQRGHSEVVKLLFLQPGIDRNATDQVE